MIRIYPEIFYQSAGRSFRQAGYNQVDGRRGEGKIVIVIIPDQNLDLSVFASCNGIDVGLYAHSRVHDVVSRQRS